MGPYLELLGALDRLWGTGTTAPAEATFDCGDRVRTYRRAPDGAYVGAGALVAPGLRRDARIVLDSARTSCEMLPESDEVPTIVIRSSGLSMPMRDDFGAPAGRAEPFASCDGEEEIRAALEAVLRAVFAKERLIEGQFEAVTEVLAGRDCAVLLPTGAGKSMTYQLAGLCLPGRTLIIDPLVALIEDQLDGLRSYGIDRVVGISSGSVDRGPEAADAYFTFVTPERLQRQTFRDALTEGAAVAPINLAVIDEAHCVSEWGHDFRPAYLNFGRTLRSACRGALGVPPLLALTGTASRVVLTDVLFHLGITNEQENSIVRPSTFDRPELSYRVVVSRPADSQAVLLSELRAMPGRLDAVAARFFEPTGRSDTYSGIVFVPTVNGWHGLFETLEVVRRQVRSAVPYSGGAPRGTDRRDWEREKVENSVAFKENRKAAIVTTNAFGMGIDKPNIRWIIHYGLPRSIEAFYQEVGRAGRDRQDAHSVLILAEHDRGRNRHRLDAEAHSGAKPRQSERDDVDTALWFHRQSFPSEQEERQCLLRMFDMLATGDRRVPLGRNGQSSDADKRALHRLAVLGIVDDYCLEGGPGREAADVRCRETGPDDILEGLLGFVERSQPGRLEAIRAEVDTSHDDVRSVVEHCGRVLIDFVYGTIERSRKRSLLEMWLLAVESSEDPEADGEVVRRRVLDYLTEGDIARLVEGLAGSSRFAFEDWVCNWSDISSENDIREWRSAAVRLLGSYPDHPGLLASRGLAEALLPDGDLKEFEQHLEQSLAQARESYQAEAADTEAVVLWLLALFGGTGGAGVVGSAVQPLVRRTRENPPALAAAVVSAARRGAVASVAVDGWLDGNWRSDPQLAVLKLADGMEAAAEFARATADRYNGRDSR